MVPHAGDRRGLQGGDGQGQGVAVALRMEEEPHGDEDCCGDDQSCQYLDPDVEVEELRQLVPEPHDYLGGDSPGVRDTHGPG